MAVSQAASFKRARLFPVSKSLQSRLATFCLRFSTRVAARHAKLAFGLLTLFLPCGSRTRRFTSEDFRLNHQPSWTFSGVIPKAVFTGADSPRSQLKCPRQEQELCFRVSTDTLNRLSHSAKCERTLKRLPDTSIRRPVISPQNFVSQHKATSRKPQKIPPMDLSRPA